MKEFIIKYLIKSNMISSKNIRKINVEKQKNYF